MVQLDDDTASVPRVPDYAIARHARWRARHIRHRELVELDELCGIARPSLELADLVDRGDWWRDVEADLGVPQRGRRGGGGPQWVDAMTDSPLRHAIETAMVEHGLSLKDLTVLSPQVDPFRMDTPANHRDGAWLADAASTLGLLDGGRQIHLRGLHYAITMAKSPMVKPDDTTYVNDSANWEWLSENAAKAARWLGYIPFDRFYDKRNATPMVRLWTPPNPEPYLSIGLNIDIPDVEDIAPEIKVGDFRGTQPYKIVMIGEKASLEEGLAPVATEAKADLYLPTGNMSDTLVHQIAKVGSDDGRPMVILYFSDCDPSGWNMPIEVGRKLQAFKELLYPNLEFRAYRALLTPEQVPTLGLPSAPLKETERRGDKWRAAWGIEQTEIDALTIPTEVGRLRRLARAAIAPFYDRTLDVRVFEAQAAWLARAQQVVDDSLDASELDRVRTVAAERLAELRVEIEALRDALRVDVTLDDLPPIEIPEAELTQGLAPEPLLDSRWSFANQCQALIDSKAYRDGAS